MSFFELTTKLILADAFSFVSPLLFRHRIENQTCYLRERLRGKSCGRNHRREGSGQGLERVSSTSLDRVVSFLFSLELTHFNVSLISQLLGTSKPPPSLQDSSSPLRSSSRRDTSVLDATGKSKRETRRPRSIDTYVSSTSHFSSLGLSVIS